MLTTHLLLNITELTLVRSSINVVSVRKPSASMHTLVNITGFTLVRSLMSVSNVENSSDIVQSFSDIRNFIVLNKSGIHVMVSLGRVLGIAQGRGTGRVPRGKDKGALDTTLRRIFSEMEVGVWRMQSLLQVGIWEYRIGRKFLLFREILAPCHSSP